MPTPTLISELSVTAAANSPQGTESPAILDDIMRSHAAFIAQLAAGTGFNSTTGTGAMVRATSPTITLANLSTSTADGTNEVGFRHVPQVSQSVAYTLVLTDAGKHILHPSADITARTFTIPANAAVAFPIGTAVTFVNQSGAGVITIAITADVMRLAALGTTGSRTLTANGIATALKLTATEWIISGSGLS